MKFATIDKIIISLAILSTLFLSLGFSFNVFGQIYEDQLTVCNFEDNCQVINIDDYMSKNKADKLNYNFNNNLDTFDQSDMTQNKQDYHEDILIQLDDMCREQYYKFCFGTAWNSLQDALS